MIVYVPYVATAGGGGGGGLTFYIGFEEAPGGTVTGDPDTERDAFITDASAGSLDILNFEDSGVWEIGSTTEGDFVLEGVTMNINNDGNGTANSANNGRFNTSPSPDAALFGEYSLYDDGSTVVEVVFTFTPNISGFAFFVTDPGDFSRGNINVELTDEDDNIVGDHQIAPAETASGALAHYGFFDTSGTKYKKVRVYIEGGIPSTATDGIGIDDLIVVP